MQENLSAEDDATVIQAQDEQVVQTVLDNMEQRSRMTALLDPRKLDIVNTDEDIDALPLPEKWQEHLTENADYTWRIGLHKLDADVEPTGLYLNKDVLLGRSDSASQPSSVDLSIYEAQEHGVSRIHAMLRPTHRKLFIIDMQSTNGTQINAHPLGPSTARALESDDIISLGDLTFIIKIYDSPATK